jgi:hypothetical protein
VLFVPVVWFVICTRLSHILRGYRVVHRFSKLNFVIGQIFLVHRNLNFRL